MKKHLFGITLLSCLCAATQANAASNILVAYYSKTGNTQIVAQEIAQELKADIYEIKPASPYPADYHTTTEQAKEEIKNGIKPPLADALPNLSAYKVIFIGTPIWWGHIASPVRTFVTQGDFQGKTVIPFCTHGGSGIAFSQNDIKTLATGANVLDGRCFYGSSATNSATDIEHWLKQLKLKGN